MRKLAFPLVIASAALLLGGCPDMSGSGGGGLITGGSGSSGGSSSGGGTTSTGGTSGGTATTSDADRILELVNNERGSRGLTALTRNALLDTAADAHADDMAANSFFSHTGSDGNSVSNRATAAGYVWSSIGENIGQADVTPAAMMNLWMNSDGHRANILNPDYTELGVGINGSGVTLWVQVFGRP